MSDTDISVHVDHSPEPYRVQGQAGVRFEVSEDKDMLLIMTPNPQHDAMIDHAEYWVMEESETEAEAEAVEGAGRRTGRPLLPVGRREAG